MTILLLGEFALAHLVQVGEERTLNVCAAVKVWGSLLRGAGMMACARPGDDKREDKTTREDETE